eukprot:1902277-Rhodomonas_salina.2
MGGATRGFRYCVASLLRTRCALPGTGLGTEQGVCRMRCASGRWCTRTGQPCTPHVTAKRSPICLPLPRRCPRGGWALCGAEIGMICVARCADLGVICAGLGHGMCMVWCKHMQIAALHYPHTAPQMATQRRRKLTDG